MIDLPSTVSPPGPAEKDSGLESLGESDELGRGSGVQPRAMGDGERLGAAGAHLFCLPTSSKLSTRTVPRRSEW